jgi:hypothetical protein
MLLSFLIPSRNTFFLTRFLDHLEKNTIHKKDIEVIIKLDDDLDNSDFINKTQKNYDFKIKFLISPRLEGQPSLWFAVEQLFQLSNQNSYFIQILSDEPHITTYGWDEVLKKYKNFFVDDVFRLRTSNLKYYNYTNEFDCVTKPDSYPIYTRRWLELTIGCGDCWGSDAYQQLISYYLSLGPLNYLNFENRSGALSRDIPINDIEYSGLEWGIGVEGEYQKYIKSYMINEWNRLISKKNLENISYKSMRIFLFIFAKSIKLKKFQILRSGNCLILKNLDTKKNTETIKLTFKIFPKTLNHLHKYFLYMYQFDKKNILKDSFQSIFRDVSLKRIMLKNIIRFIFFMPIRYIFYLLKLNKFKILKKIASSLKILAIRFLNKIFLLETKKIKIKKEEFNIEENIFPTNPKTNFIIAITNIFHKKNFKFKFNPPGFQFHGFNKNIKIPQKIGEITDLHRNYAFKELNSLQKFKKDLEEKIYE